MKTRRRRQRVKHKVSAKRRSRKNGGGLRSRIRAYMQKKKNEPEKAPAHVPAPSKKRRHGPMNIYEHIPTPSPAYDRLIGLQKPESINKKKTGSYDRLKRVTSQPTTPNSLDVDNYVLNQSIPLQGQKRKRSSSETRKQPNRNIKKPRTVKNYSKSLSL